MKITHVLTEDRGGAAIAALNIHDGLMDQGLESNVVVLKRKINRRSIHKYSRKSLQSRKIIRERIDILSNNRFLIRSQNKVLRGRPKDWEFFGLPLSPFRVENMQVCQQADIVHLHWVDGFVNFPTFFRNINKPIAWTMHDMNAFTGGCHYTFDCLQYKDECSSCPQLKSKPEATKKFQRIKAESLSGRNIQFIANSHWIEECARDSRLLKSFPIQTIHYPLDFEQYRPIDKTIAKQALGLNPDLTTVAFGADFIKNKRKGLHHLTETLNQLASRGKEFTAIVIGDTKGQKYDANFNVAYLNRLTETRLLSLAYSAGDIFIMPSLLEAFGLMSVEAMACRTPVVAFDNSGAQDYIVPMETGVMARGNDFCDLGDKITLLLDHPKLREEMGIKARDFVKDNFDPTQQARKYITLYENLLTN